MKKLKRACGRYKGKLPFKCLKCGKIGHFASRFPYNQSKYNDDEEYHNNKERKIIHKGGKYENWKRFNQNNKSLF